MQYSQRPLACSDAAGMRIKASGSSTRAQDTPARTPQTSPMRNTRLVTAFGLVLVEGALAVLGVLVHYGFTAEYGDVTASALEEFRWGFPSGIGGLALVIVGTAAMITAWVSPRGWLRAIALVIPVLLVTGMYAVTPAALAKKLDDQYSASPRCVTGEDPTEGPGAEAAFESQRAFDSIGHVGHFGGGGSSGVGGCARAFVLTEDVDVLQHYRAALFEAGWAITESDGQHLRARREAMAFEVLLCDHGGAVWAGRDDLAGGAQCDQQG